MSSLAQGQTTCEQTLNLCQHYVATEDASIRHLTDLAKTYKDQRDLALLMAAKNSKDPLLPDWAWFAAGAVLATGVWGFYYYKKH